MSLLQSVLYGLISGLSEFMPVSSHAHQSLMRYMFGVDTRDSLQDLLVHIGLIMAIYEACRERIYLLLREQKILSTSRRSRQRFLGGRTLYDLRLLTTATVSLLMGLILSFFTVNMENDLLSLIVFLTINALILLFSEHAPHGNRDARTMSRLDGVAIGIVGAFSVFPGISRTGAICAYARARGADSHSTANWAVLLGIPALLFAVFFDVFWMVSAGIGTVTFYAVACYFLSGIASFCGGYLGISILRIALNHSGLSGFAYYSIGAALFSFILYLIT